EALRIIQASRGADIKAEVGRRRLGATTQEQEQPVVSSCLHRASQPTIRRKKGAMADWADSTPLVSGGRKEEKLGHKICGCCCDSRRAVLIYNIFDIIFVVLGIAVIVVANGNPDWHAQTANQGIDWNTYYQTSLIVLCVALFIRTATILGACLFNWCLVGLGALWTIVAMVLGIVSAVMVISEVQVNSVNTQVYYSSNPAGSIVVAIIWNGLVLYVRFLSSLSKHFPPAHFVQHSY
ncbi:hypothetical protein ACHAWF_004980, partial [Thalassiosira exigua]